MTEDQAINALVEALVVYVIRPKYWVLCASKRDSKILATSLAYTFAQEILLLVRAMQRLGFHHELAERLTRPFVTSGGQKFDSVDLIRVQELIEHVVTAPQEIHS